MEQIIDGGAGSLFASTCILLGRNVSYRGLTRYWQSFFFQGLTALHFFWIRTDKVIGSIVRQCGFRNPAGMIYESAFLGHSSWKAIAEKDASR
jgi:hypothetical protein